MTKIIKVNCDKWKKVIGISLWFGVTIGLAIGLCSLINYQITHGFVICNSFFDFKSNTYTCRNDPDYLGLGFGFGIALLSNIGNSYMIWKTLNDKYKILKFECVSK